MRYGGSSMTNQVKLYQNQWDIKYDFKQLNTDFDFYCIVNTFEDKKFAALSSKIQFSIPQVLNVKVSKKKSYIIVKKSRLGEEDFKRLNDYFDPIKVNIDKVQSQDVCNISNFGGITDRNFHALTCLILGLLPIFSERNGIAQIDGHTYFFKPKKVSKWHKKDRAIGVVIEPEYHHQRFRIKARTFAKLNEFNREETSQFFIWDDDKGILKRTLTAARNQEEDFYSNKAIPKNRASINELDLSSLEDYQNTKMGILDTFMEEVRRHLEKYISLKINTMDNIDYHTARYTQKDHKDDYIEYFADKTIYLIDLIKSEESKEFIANFQSTVNDRKKFDKINFQLSDRPLKGLNLALLHNLEYYDSDEAIERGEKDPHLVMTNGQIIQHITIEDFDYYSRDGKIAPSMIKVFQELILKEVNSKLQLNYLTKLDYFKNNGPLSFAMYVEESEECFGLYLQTIDVTGKLTYRYFSPGNISQNTDPLLATLERMRLSRKDKYSEYENHNKVAGFVIKNPDDIAMIYETNMSTISDFEYIKGILEDTPSKDKTVIVENLTKVVEEFLEKYKEHPKFQKGREFYETLKTYGYKETVETIRSGFDLRGKSSILKELNDEIHSQLDYFIWPPIRTVEYERSYGNILHINCFEDKGKNYYFVGVPKKGISTAPIARTTKIREFVLSRKSAIQFLEIRDLFDIDLVKNGTMTVYPFPFKLLREYIDNEKRKMLKS